MLARPRIVFAVSPDFNALTGTLLIVVPVVGTSLVTLTETGPLSGRLEAMSVPGTPF
jgi:hypothetical protein